MAAEGPWVVKVRAPGVKRARLLASPSGATTGLRLHAILFRDKARAKAVADALVEQNPGFAAEVAR